MDFLFKIHRKLILGFLWTSIVLLCCAAWFWCYYSVSFCWKEWRKKWTGALIWEFSNWDTSVTEFSLLELYTNYRILFGNLTSFQNWLSRFWQYMKVFNFLLLKLEGTSLYCTLCLNINPGIASSQYLEYYTITVALNTNPYLGTAEAL